MTNRIVESSGETEFNIKRQEDVQAHIVRLRELAKVLNRTMCAIIAFEIRIGFSISELEAARLNAGVTDLHRSKALLTAREAAHKLGIPVQVLRRDRGQQFPEPVRGSGVGALYSQSQVDDWLLAKL
jgi:ribosomal protein L13E